MKNWKFYPKAIMQLFAVGMLLMSAVGASLATTYNVGPTAGYLAKLSDVPWRTLNAGDIVNIHYQPNGYHEIIHISRSGTAAQPIIIRGIPDPATGDLPVIDGNGAIMDPHVDFRSTVFENFGVIIVTAAKKNYNYGVTFPSWITIESLDIRNALYKKDGSLSFTDVHGKNRIFDPFACGIYIEFAQHLTIRGCEISFNGNGIFANSKNQAAQCSKDLLIEANYIHDNGQPVIPGLSNGFHEHNVYIESDGAVYQYNRFGPLRAGCHGTMIKDRSAGTIIRYNEAISTECSNIFAILDPQGGSGYLEFKSYYPDAYVYGNVITMKPSSNSQSSIVWFGAYNGKTFYPTEHRGTLYFYNNTVVNHQGNVSIFELTDLPYTPTPDIFEKVDCRNNIIYTDTSVNANVYKATRMIISGANAHLDMGKNWLSPKTTKLWLGHEGGSVVSGWANQIVGDAGNLNDPHFVDMATRNYRLTTASKSVDQAGVLNPEVLTHGFNITEQYNPPMKHRSRPVLGVASDLGAYEGTPADTIIVVNNSSGSIGTTKSLTAVLKQYFTGAKIANKTLTFSIGGTVLGSGVTDVNGKATLSYKLPESFGVGVQPLSLSFAGDAPYNPGTGSGSLTINKAPTKLYIPTRSGKVGAKINLKAKLYRTTDSTLLHGKVVHFQIDGVDVGSTTTVAGYAHLPYTISNTLSVGDHSITTTFDGDALYLNVTNSGGVITVTP